MDQHVIEHINPEELTPHPDNSMKHGDSQITQLVASFEQFGFNGVIVIDENDVVLAGHGRRLAAIRAGMTTVPCLRRSGLTEAQKRAYIIADNKIGRESEWDVEVLERQLQELSSADLDLDSLGISADALASITTPKRKSAAGGERAKPIPIKADADKLRQLAVSMIAAIENGGRMAMQTIGCVEGVTFQLVATGTVETKRRKVDPVLEEFECLMKSGRKKEEK